MSLPDSSAENPSKDVGELVYIGCYTAGHGGDGEGLVVAVRDRSTGALQATGVVQPSPSPSFVAPHPSLPVVYAVHELADGLVSSFTVAPNGAPQAGGSTATGGSFPCHVSVHPDGGYLFVANYGSGSVSVFELAQDGAIVRRSDVVSHTGRGPNPARQEGPHAHMVLPHADRILAVDLGIDAVISYRLDAGRLVDARTVARLQPGLGPRHLAVGAGLVHVAAELGAQVVSYEEGADGWREIGAAATSSVMPALCSAIVASPDGRFVYVANRGPDTIAVVSVESGAPKLVREVACGGTWPRDMAMCDGFLYVANERSHTVTVFRVDSSTGMLEPTGDVLSTPSPTCVLPLPRWSR